VVGYQHFKGPCCLYLQGHSAEDRDLKHRRESLKTRMSQYYHYTTYNGHQLGSSEGNFVLFISAAFFSDADVISEVN